MNDDAFRKARLAGIGSSDSAAACGLSKWRSALDVFLEKRGELPARTDTEWLKWGRILERPIREEYESRTGHKVERLPIAWSATHPFMLANLDGMRDDRRVVEIKTSRTAEGWGDEGTDDIPQDYLCQTMHQMIVVEARSADVAVLIGGSDFRVYTVEFDPEFAEFIVAAERDLWERIQRGEPPTAESLGDIAKLYPRSVERPVEASSEVRGWLAILHRARENIASSEKTAEEAELAVKAFMAEADTLTVEGRIAATWRTAKASRVFDTKRFKIDYPSMVEQYEIERPGSRRFLLK